MAKIDYTIPCNPQPIALTESQQFTFQRAENLNPVNMLKATDNIMSYYPENKILWNWQLKFLNIK